MIAIHAYKQTRDIELNHLVLLTQYMSVITFKKNNPTHQFVLYTDSNTLLKYKEFGIHAIYDQINTTILDSYPTEDISKNFWASPKLWVMMHMNSPFVIMDTDLIWHGKVTDHLDYSFSYLHRESPTIYPLPHQIESREDWNWDNNIKEGFNHTHPINCALLIFNDLDFVKKYTKYYFDFVKNNTGELLVSEDDLYFINKFGAQITMEQWLLAAMEYRENKFGNNVTSYSILDLMAYNNRLTHYDFNKSNDTVYSEIEKYIYHLWGAKSHYEKGEYVLHGNVSNYLLNGCYTLIKRHKNYNHIPIIENIRLRMLSK